MMSFLYKKYALTLSKLTGCSLVLLCLTGCEFNNTYSQIEDTELRRQAYRCVINSNPSTAEIQVCKNIRRECDKRRENGRFVC